MATMTYKVRKRLGPYSTVHRNHRARSHCRFLHGYGRCVEITLGAKKLDRHGWVYDFGGFGPVRRWLDEQWDHKVVLVDDDPELEAFKLLHERGLMDLVVIPARYDGLEGQALRVYDWIAQWLVMQGDCRARDVRVESVQVFEHEANSAIVTKEESILQEET